MELPPLPKKYNRKESKVDGLVINWFKENYPFSCAIEVKVGKNKLLPHQELALKEVTNGSFGYKIADSGIRLPFDGFVLKGAHAFVVTCVGMKCVARNIANDKEFNIDLTNKKPH